ncbi:hypothetical protein ABIC83_003000 [Roseateles asaccharophilus]|uniref:hypothetical protein n=1 Tax=Roseateles asaccharophilus TaxID=582607 RepID=UPI003833CAF4
MHMIQTDEPMGAAGKSTVETVISDSTSSGSKVEVQLALDKAKENRKVNSGPQQLVKPFTAAPWYRRFDKR